MTSFDNLQVVFTYDRAYGTPPSCIRCGRPVGRRDGYLALWAGPVHPPELLAVARPGTWEGPGDDDWDTAGSDALSARWCQLLDAAGPGVLEEGKDPGGRR